MVNTICKRCGKEFETYPCRIRNGFSVYCSQKCKGTHGFAKGNKTRFYKIYLDINQRLKPYHTFYKNYGGRGIKCLWKSFEEFRDDMFETYQSHVDQFGEKNTSIDRIDNNGNYCKENCKWATRKEQMRNTRCNVLLTYLGQTKTLVEWSEEFGMEYSLLHQRIKRDKWSIDKALTTMVA